MILELKESDLEEQFDRSSGPGGQNVNKVATKVLLRHLPTGIAVAVQDTRSQAENRKLARERLLQALQTREADKKKRQEQEREKERRRKRPRPKNVKRKMVESKRHRAKNRAQRQVTFD